MPPLRCLGACVAVVGLVAAGCARGGERASRPTPRPTSEAESPAMPGAAATAAPADAEEPRTPTQRLESLGRFYLVMGAERQPTHLHVMDWGTLDPRPLAPSIIVTNVTSCGDVVVATATSERDGKVVANWLARVTKDRIEPIEGAGSSNGAPLAADESCRFAYVVERSGRHVVRSWDPKSGDFSDLYGTDEAAGRVDWYGDELLLRVGASEEDWRIVAVRDGTARDLDVVTRPGDSFRAHTSGWLALSDPLKAPLLTRLQHLGDGRKLELRGWTPVTWLPGEPRMLVRDADTLALVSVPSLAIEEVGAWTHDPIWSGAWTP